MPAGSDDEQRRIAALIDDLNCHSEGTDEEAQAELIGMGPVVVDALVERVSELDAGGQLCAIEVFRSLRAERAGAPLIALLRLTGANLEGADLRGATFHPNTVWPEGFEPSLAGLSPIAD